MNQLLTQIRKELKTQVEKDYKKDYYRFFKEPIKIYGVRTPLVRKIANKYFAEIKDLEKKQIFKLSEELLKSGYNEEATIAFQWAYALRKKFQLSDFKIFESWLKKYVDNWGKCDDYCTHVLGEFILQYPKYLPQLNVWAKSKNRWVRRAAAVILIYPVRYKEDYLKKVFAIADILLMDEDDLVQKGYGWMLKEAGNKYQKQVFIYVMKNKHKMPRTALRYAIEKMPQNLRQKALAK